MRSFGYNHSRILSFKVWFSALAIPLLFLGCAKSHIKADQSKPVVTTSKRVVTTAKQSSLPTPQPAAILNNEKSSPWPLVFGLIAASGLVVLWALGGQKHDEPEDRPTSEHLPFPAAPSPTS